MKKLFTSILALLSAAILLQAGPVTPEKALDVAGKLLASGMPGTKADELPLRILSQDDAMYIVAQDGGGFVIVAADDEVRPILGFSETNTFSLEGMPDNVRWWMDYLRRHTRAAIETSGSAPQARKRSVRAQWDAFADTKSALSNSKISDKHEDFFTVNWDQTDPANLDCPTVSGQGSRSICGCYPLAVSMIMVHHGFPTMGTGTVPAYSYYAGSGGRVNLEARPLNTEYDWEGMRALKTYSQFRNAKDPVKTNLAKLVRDVGQIFEAQYNTGDYGGTGVSDYQSSLAPSLMAKYMGYSENAHVEYKEEQSYWGTTQNYTDEQWTQLMYQEIQKRPFLFCGYSIGSWGNDAGHAYIIDGYALYNNTDRVFHFNFGWGGECNGYYYASAQDVDDYVFDDYLEALLDFEPSISPEFQTATLGFESAYVYSTGQNEGGISLSSGDAVASSTVTATIYNIVNKGAKPFSGKAWLQVVDRNGNVKQTALVKDFSASPLAFGSKLASQPCIFTLKQPVSFGDHIVAVFSRDSDDDIYPFEYTDDGNIVGECPLMPSAFIQTEASYKTGASITFKLRNCNYYYGSASWSITEPSGTVRQYAQSAGSVKLSSSGTYKVVVTTSKEKLTTYITVK